VLAFSGRTTAIASAVRRPTLRAVPPWSSHGSGQPVSPTGPEAVYRQLFDSFDRDRDDKVSQRAVLSRLLGCGLLPNDPRISEALAGLAGADGGSRQLSFGQFKALVRHDSSLIRRAVEGDLAVPDFAVLTADIERMYGELLPVRSGSVADYIPQLKRVDSARSLATECRRRHQQRIPETAPTRPMGSSRRVPCAHVPRRSAGRRAVTSASLSLMARLTVLHGVCWTFPCGRRSSRSRPPAAESARCWAATRRTASRSSVRPAPCPGQR
jgi:hypothetical protein